MNPAPVDLSRLKGILGNAKKIMQQAEVEKPIVMSEMTEKQTTIEERAERAATVNQPQQVQGYTTEQVMNSNLPDIVKQAMIKNPIPQLTGLPQRFTATDILEEDEDYGKPMDFSNMPKKRSVTEQRQAPVQQAGMITISESQLEALINKKLLEFFATHYNKSLTENAIKTTISTLIKEGKIQGKKKTI